VIYGILEPEHRMPRLRR